MLTTLCRKHWMELRGVWALNMAMLGFVAILGVQVSIGLQGFMLFLVFFGLAVLTARFAGTGLATSPGIRAHRGTDPSLLFTLSLPARRRTLFFYRTGFCLLAIETAAVLGLLMCAVVFAHSGGLMQVFTEGLRILLLIVPLYFLDSLLSIRFDPVTTMQIQIFGAAGVWFVLPPLVGVKPQDLMSALSGITAIRFALLTLLIAAGLAAITVWKLDRQDY